jgi:anthranilate synthase
LGLDQQRGCIFESSYEYPGRYARWSIGFRNPPLSIEGTGSSCRISALNARGRVLMPAVLRALGALREDGTLRSLEASSPALPGYELAEATGDELDNAPTLLEMELAPRREDGTFSEEDRSRQPSLFSVIRCVRGLFGFSSSDGQLGLYGAFGYDLAFQFEPIEQSLPRDPGQRDLLLYLPDEILVVDQDKKDAWVLQYDFAAGGRTTTGLPRSGLPAAFQPHDGSAPFEARDTPEGSFSESVAKAKEEFKVGNLFEAVISQTFRNKLGRESPPSQLFRRLRERNPSPYG